MAIKYTQSNVASRPTFRTEKFGNLLSDTYQGQVEQGSDELWAGWFFNLSNNSNTKFRLGLKSKGTATRWVNQQLRGVGVR